LDRAHALALLARARRGPHREPDRSPAQWCIGDSAPDLGGARRDLDRPGGRAGRREHRRVGADHAVRRGRNRRPLLRPPYPRRSVRRADGDRALIGAVDPDQARRVARDILGGRQYHASPTPRPLRHQLTWIGDRVHGFAGWIGRGLSHIPEGVAIAFAAAVLGIAVWIIVRYARGRRGRPDSRTPASAVGADATEDPRDLERAADAAERARRFDEALRLRFRA